jgi:hypothetical protein
MYFQSSAKPGNGTNVFMCLHVINVTTNVKCLLVCRMDCPVCWHCGRKHYLRL